MGQRQGPSHEPDHRTARRDQDRDAATEPVAAQANPVLGLQQTAGNRAVQRLVGEEGNSRPAGVIQRHVAPGTAATGTAAHASLTAHSANVLVEASQLQAAAGSLQQLGSGLLQDASQVLVFQILAENYPATQPAGGEAPASATGGGHTTSD